MSYTITVNGISHTVDVDGDTPLLWVIRDTLGLTGTKFGCGVAACGACTVKLNGAQQRSCVMPIQVADGAEIETIESLGDSSTGKALQEAWIAEQVPQCGYCQSGMLMAAADLLTNGVADPSDEDIAKAMTNICRCGTYNNIRRAIKRAAKA